MKKLILMMLFFVGCSEDMSTVDDCIKQASSTAKFWEQQVLKWVKKDNTKIFRDTVNEKRISELMQYYATNISLNYECAIPLYLKVKHNLSRQQKLSNQLKNIEKLIDIRHNPDSNFDIEFILFGEDVTLLRNRLYFVYPQENHVVVWSRRIDCIHAKHNLLPSQKCLYNNQIGLYSIFKDELGHVFLGNHEYNMESFIQKALKEEAFLYWECGIWKGLSEGMHILKAETFKKWVAQDNIMAFKLKIIFHSHNTTIFSIY